MNYSNFFTETESIDLNKITMLNSEYISNLLNINTNPINALDYFSKQTGEKQTRIINGLMKLIPLSTPITSLLLDYSIEEENSLSSIKNMNNLYFTNLDNLLGYSKFDHSLNDIKMEFELINTKMEKISKEKIKMIRAINQSKLKEESVIEEVDLIKINLANSEKELYNIQLEISKHKKLINNNEKSIKELRPKLKIFQKRESTTKVEVQTIIKQEQLLQKSIDTQNEKLFEYKENISKLLLKEKELEKKYEYLQLVINKLSVPIKRIEFLKNELSYINYTKTNIDNKINEIDTQITNLKNYLPMSFEEFIFNRSENE